MFEFVRKHTKLIMGVLFVLIIPSFVLFGIDSYTGFMSGAGKVASVNGVSITQTEWDEALRRETDRLRNANPGLDISLLDTPTFKYSVLERMVRDRVLAAAATDEHLSVSNERLAATLREDPAIANLRQPDGKLDMQAYERLLAQQGMTPEGFEALVRGDLSRQQVLEGVLGSSFSTPAQAGVTLNAFLEQRKVRLLHFAPAEHSASVTPTDADLQTYYQQHQGQYQAPETASVEYLVFDLDSLKKDITPSEEDLRTYYKQNEALLGKPEERRAAHILIAAAKDAPAAEREKAKARAEELLAKLRQNPASFADEARRSSQDDVSAAKGGDLGSFQRNRGRDSGLDPALVEAIFTLAKKGDISDVVETEFGYHILQLGDITAANLPPFEQVRAKLADDFRTQEAQKRFVIAAEDFRNGVYEQADTLAPTAEKLKLSLQRADNIGRTPAQGATGALASPQFLAALFNPGSIEKKENTEAIEIGPNQIAAGRLLSYQPAHARPFDEVKDQVRQAFIAQRAAELAAQQGQARLKEWNEKPDSATGLAAAIDLSRENTHQQPPQVVEAVLRADPAKLPTFVGVNLGADGYTIARIEQVLPRATPTPEQAAQELQRYTQAWTMVEGSSYYEELKTRYKAKITAPAPTLGAALQAPAGH